MVLKLRLPYQNNSLVFFCLEDCLVISAQAFPVTVHKLLCFAPLLNMIGLYLISGIAFILMQVVKLQGIERFLSPSSFSLHNDQLSLNKRIVGGTKVPDPNQYQWAVAILYKSRHNLLCGGSLITDRHVLTAAHCFKPLDAKPEDLMIRAGLSAISGSAGLIKRVVRIITHEMFGKPLAGCNDVAILELDSPIPLPQDGIKPCCLAKKGMAEVGVMATVVGYGHVSEKGQTSDVLMEVSVPIVSKDLCKKVFGKLFTNKMICAGMTDGSRDSCQGDSGGPIMTMNNGAFHVVGVVSFGSGCAKPGSYGVYTRIPYYLEWITTHVAGAKLTYC